ncbi:hypothetical protein [Streptomyces mangrovisoli]|uniref:hypothetical protein n=1 Tax=Streptomyces mangrovisoli TaxID=1428628 RepID=UPI0011609606|nr:hypothetical protein [Streptomyces mangrovisoli]
MRAVKDIIAMANGLAAHRGLTFDHAPLEPTRDNLDRLHEAEVRRHAEIETVRLLTDTDTISAARQLNHCVWHLLAMSRGDEPGDPAQWSEAFTAYRLARDEFHRCARATLGIPGTAIARDQTWPPRWTHRRDSAGPSNA